MPSTRQAAKRIRSGKKRKLRNLHAKSELKTLTKSFLKLVEDGSKTEADKVFRSLTKRLDQAGQRNIVHKNTVSRKKSQLAKQLAKLHA